MRETTLFLLLLLPALLRAEMTAQQPPALVFTHVTVIDATGAAAQSDMTVVITGDRITALGKTGQVTTPNDAQVVDAAGKFLIPGLWDMHAHIAIFASMRETRLRLLIANGVTGVRDLFGSLEAIDEWREEIAAGTLLGPRIVAAGRILDGPGSREFSIASNAAEGRQAVLALRQEGSDFVKVYSLLPREAYFAIADEARKQNIPFAGHVPHLVTVAEASDAGQKSIEHLTGMVFAGSTRENELMRELTQMPQLDAIAARRFFNRIEASSIDTYSEQKIGSLFARLVRNGTWQCPTLTMLRGLAFLDDPRTNDPDDPRLKYISPSTRQQLWNPGNPNLERSAADSAVEKNLYRKRLELVGAMHRAGVGILAGTDMGNPYCFPGFGLHDEIELMVQAGLTPMQALQTATLNPAKYLGLLDSLGTVEKDKLADLVLLEANPLTDIHNTRKINAVVVNGRLLDRAKLDRMLAEAEVAVNRK